MLVHDEGSQLSHQVCLFSALPNITLHRVDRTVPVAAFRCLLEHSGPKPQRRPGWSRVLSVKEQQKELHTDDVFRFRNQTKPGKNM
jgi:hypothetical protein